MIFGKQMITGLVVSLAGIGSWHIAERANAYEGLIKLLARVCMVAGIFVSL